MTHHDQSAVRGLIGELLDPSVEVKHADAMRHDRKRSLTVRCVVHTLLPTARAMIRTCGWRSAR